MIVAKIETRSLPLSVLTSFHIETFLLPGLSRGRGKIEVNNLHMNEIIVIGGGLAGVEAAWQAANTGARVRLHEMRPMQKTPAHRTDKLAEIVCSNSLKSDEPGTASYLLKEELRRGRSLVLEAAVATKIPAGAALAVDRIKFAELVTARIESHPNIEIVRGEIR